MGYMCVYDIKICSNCSCKGNERCSRVPVCRKIGQWIVGFQKVHAIRTRWRPKGGYWCVAECAESCNSGPEEVRMSGTSLKQQEIYDSTESLVKRSVS